jgi:hypothetical protein
MYASEQAKDASDIITVREKSVSETDTKGRQMQE